MSDETGATLSELLTRLEGIVEPAPVSWVPQTVSWLVLGIVLLGLVFVLAFWSIRRWRSNRYRREALAELAAIEKRLRAGDHGAIVTVAVLLRRVALHIAPRERVASLTGEKWLGFLNGHVRHSVFTESAARLLIDVAYAPLTPPARDRSGGYSDDRMELVGCARSWVRRHHA
jgi:hypothetical protein